MNSLYRGYDQAQTQVVGNDYSSDASQGFKQEVEGIFESYMNNGVNLITDLGSIIMNPTERQNFIGALTESFQSDPWFESKTCASEPFYSNYSDRFEQLADNSLTRVAQESVMQGYSPIVAYNPFFLKKQWVSCIFKDVLMTEVPASPVINLGFERRYVRTLDGTEYEIPDVFYNDEAMATLSAASTGLPMTKTDEIELPLKNVDILTNDYFEGIVVNDRAEMLTQDLHIVAVHFKTEAGDVWVPCDLQPEATTHTWDNKVLSNGKEGGEAKTDNIVGMVDFKAGTITVFSANDNIDKIKMTGKLANRWNERSLDVKREVTHIQKQMPESGPRLNTSITIEEAADALALQKIDMIADNVDMMGRTLAELEDYEIRTFLDASYNAQLEAKNGPYGYETTIVTGAFDALPYDGYTGNVTAWMKDSREYFERVINQLKQKLKTPEGVVVAVCHPTLVRFLQDGIDWVFDNNTTVSGMKIAYSFGIYTTGQDRVHLITSHYLKPEMGIMLLVIPTTSELITYKHYKYNMVIDRGYRNPLHDLTPNVMATHRTLTFEILPVQGRLTIDGTDLVSPKTLSRAGGVPGAGVGP